MARIRGGRNLEARFLGSIAYIGGRRGRGASMAFRSRTGHVRGVNDERQKERYRVYTRVRLLFEFLIAFFRFSALEIDFGEEERKKRKKKNHIVLSFEIKFPRCQVKIKIFNDPLLFFIPVYTARSNSPHPCILLLSDE